MTPADAMGEDEILATLERLQHFVKMHLDVELAKLLPMTPDANSRRLIMCSALVVMLAAGNNAKLKTVLNIIAEFTSAAVMLDKYRGAPCPKN